MDPAIPDTNGDVIRSADGQMLLKKTVNDIRRKPGTATRTARTKHLPKWKNKKKELSAYEQNRLQNIAENSLRLERAKKKSLQLQPKKGTRKAPQKTKSATFATRYQTRNATKRKSTVEFTCPQKKQKTQ